VAGAAAADGVPPDTAGACSAAEAAGIRTLLANAPAPSKVETFKAVLRFTISKSHLHLGIFQQRSASSADIARDAASVVARLGRGQFARLSKFSVNPLLNAVSSHALESSLGLTNCDSFADPK
jgi:hypothetical protein